jgi:hypothetical protein
MTEYQFEANTRRCAASGRDLRPGDSFYTVLQEAEGKFQRKDYSSDAWQGPPAGTFSFWAGRIPEDGAVRRPPIDDDMLLDCLERLEGDASRVHFRYVVALLLLRRRRLRLEQTCKQGDAETLVLKCARTRRQYRILNPQLSESEMSDAQKAVLDVLGW